MRPPRRLLAPVLAAALGVAGLGLAIVPAAHADTTAALPNLTRFHQMVVDSADGHLFFSEGYDSEGFANGGWASASSSALIVTSLSGQYVTTLDAGDGVEGLALDGGTLYVALGTADKVDVINAATLNDITSYPLPANDIPYGLALQSGHLWVSYSTLSSNGTPALATAGIGEMDPADGSFTAAAAGTSGWYSAPELAADPDNDGTLVATQPSTDPVQTATFNTSAAPVATLATGYLGSSAPEGECSGAAEVAVEPGGSQFAVACGAPYSVGVYNTSDFSTMATSYQIGPYPRAVAISGSGMLAAGLSFSSSSIFVYGPDGAERNIINIPSGELVPGSLEWSADGSTLYGLTESSLVPPYSYSLQVYDAAATVTPVLSLASSNATPFPGSALTISGTLTLPAGAPIAGVPVTISGGTLSAPVTLTTDSSGAFSVTDTPQVAGKYTYTASYAGDSVDKAVSTSTTVTVTPHTSKLTITAPNEPTAIVLPGTTFKVTGVLTLSGAPAAGAPVSVTRKSPNGAKYTFKTVTTGQDGSYSVTDKLTALGSYVYTANYAATTTTTASTATVFVDIAKADPAVTVKASASTVRYDSAIKVTAHLGHTHTNRTLAIYASFPGSSTKLHLKTGTVDSHGNLTITFPAAVRNVTFSAIYSGDSLYSPQTAIAKVGVEVRLSMTNSGWYKTGTAGGIVYHLFHIGNHVNYSVTVAPNKHGDCVKFEFEGLSSGNTWGPADTSACYPLSSSSRLLAYLKTAGGAAGKYRTLAIFVPSRKDVTNVTTDSGWFYFQLTS